MEQTFVPQITKKREIQVFSLSSKILNEICSSSGYQKDNFSIIGFQGEMGKKSILEEAILSARFVENCEKAPEIIK
jgi:hypothetical protein